MTEGHNKAEKRGTKEMKQSLQERCEAQIRNETDMRRVAKIEHEAVLKLCAMMHVNAGREVNPEHMKELFLRICGQ